MFCTKCGNQLKDGEKFCTNCGAKVIPDAVGGNADQKSAEEKIKWKEFHLCGFRGGIPSLFTENRSQK